METINHECYVSLEVAKLLKEAGFDWPCNHAICCDSTHYPNLKEGDVLEYNYLECSELMEGKKPHMLLCPTLDVAQRWLREAKNIQIIASPLAGSKNWTPLIAKDFWLLHEDISGIALTPENFDTYELALESGIKKALEIILEKGE